MLAEDHEFAKEAATSIYAVSQEEAIRLQCEAREEYERDWAESYVSGHEDGLEEGREEGRKEGREEGVAFVIRSALAQGKSPEDIAAFNGMTLDEVMKYVEK